MLQFDLYSMRDSQGMKYICKDFISSWRYFDVQCMSTCVFRLFNILNHFLGSCIKMHASLNFTSLILIRKLEIMGCCCLKLCMILVMLGEIERFIR